MATQAEATLRLYQALNHPVKAGRVWVQYERKTIDAALDVLKQLMTLQGYEFRPEDTGKTKAPNA
jgi:hypothetical protein